MKLRVALPLILCVAVAPPGAVERLSIRVSPEYAFAPTTLRIRAMIEANTDNRAVEISAESLDFYRSSEMSLDGAHAPRVQLFEFRYVPGGRYVVRAILKGADGKALAAAESRALIFGKTESLTH